MPLCIHEPVVTEKKKKKQTSSVAWVHEQTIPTYLLIADSEDYVQ
jgi:hypothetical protein